MCSLSTLLNRRNVAKRQPSLLLPSSACGSNRFDTRLLMNLISLMCLCSLSPESLLLFNEVLQSYLISSPPPPARPPPVVSQHAGNTQAPGNATRSPQHVEYRGPRCVSLICVIGRRIGLDRNTVSADITVFFLPTLNSAHDLSLSLPH